MHSQKLSSSFRFLLVGVLKDEILETASEGIGGATALGAETGESLCSLNKCDFRGTKFN